MPWNMNDYPDSLRNLHKAVRKKAIDIANDLVEDGYDEGRAIPIATSQAESWYSHASQQDINDYLEYGKPTKNDSDYSSNPELLDQPELVIPHEDGWAVQSKEAKKAGKVFRVKSEAVDYAKGIAKNKESTLIIYDTNGKEQESRNYQK